MPRGRKECKAEGNFVPSLQPPDSHRAWYENRGEATSILESSDTEADVDRNELQLRQAQRERGNGRQGSRKDCGD